MAEHTPVLVVTDSTADLPEEMARRLGIVVVPLTITFGSESYRDGIDLTPGEFLDHLRRAPTLPTTSQPPVSDFETIFRTAVERGQGVVCITISSHLSGTFNAARLAAEAVGPEWIRIIDSMAATMQLGWVAVAAARAAERGDSLEAVAAEAESAKERVSLYALLQTLEYVYKGGRIGRAQQLFGSALAIKPILGVIDGIVTPVERVRTWKRALARVAEMVAPTPSDIMVMHCDNLVDAEALAATLSGTYPDAQIQIGFVGATITTYAGPGAIGVAALYPEQGLRYT